MKQVCGTSAAHFILAPECQGRLDAFVVRHGVWEYRMGYRNLFRLFRQGGAGGIRARKVLKGYWGATRGTLLDNYGYGSPFDHAELWGKCNEPLFLIGHPYSLSAEGQKTLEAIRTLGMTVLVSDSESWYGHGTIQVVVHSPRVKF
jgi:hypothetical protein